MFKKTSLFIFPIAAIAGALLPTPTVVGQQVTRVTEYRSSDEFGMARRWEKTTSVVGRKVITTTREDIGKVEDVVVDPRSGRILYSVVSFNPSVGVGEKLYAIPWHSNVLELPADNSSVVLKVERDRLRSAPSFERTQWPSFDDKYVTTIYKYYNVPTYWERDTRTTRLVSETTADGDVKVYRERWYSPPRTWHRSSELIGRTVRNRQNIELGRVTDLSIDPDTGRILYAVIESDGRYYSIPWPAFIETADNSYLILDADKELFTERVSFTADRWPNMADERWATTTYRYYKVKPYWTTKVEVDDDEIEIKRSDGKEIEIERDDDDDDDD